MMFARLIDGLRSLVGCHRDGWYLAEDPRGEIHVVPYRDAVGHEADDCPCGADLEPCPREDGSIGWLHVHHSLDNREKKE